MKLMIFGIMLMLLVVPTAQAALTPAYSFDKVYNCTNSTNLEWRAVVNANSDTYTLNQSIVCAYGCDDKLDRCIDNDITRNAYLFVIVLGILGLAGLIYKKGR